MIHLLKEIYSWCLLNKWKRENLLLDLNQSEENFRVSPFGANVVWLWNRFMSRYARPSSEFSLENPVLVAALFVQTGFSRVTFLVITISVDRFSYSFFESNSCWNEHTHVSRPPTPSSRIPPERCFFFFLSRKLLDTSRKTEAFFKSETCTSRRHDLHVNSGN